MLIKMLIKCCLNETIMLYSNVILKKTHEGESLNESNTKDPGPGDRF